MLIPAALDSHYRIFVEAKGAIKDARQGPFTIEILGSDRDRLAVVDRVIGGSVYIEEAKRIGQHLLSITEAGTLAQGYRILTNDHELVYVWHAKDNDESPSVLN